MQKRARPTRFSPGVFSSLNRGAHGAQIAFLSRTNGAAALELCAGVVVSRAVRFHEGRGQQGSDGGTAIRTKSEI